MAAQINYTPPDTISRFIKDYRPHELFYDWIVIVETNAPATVASTVVTAATFTTDVVNSAVLGASFFNLNVVENSGTASIRPTATVRYRRILT